MEKNHYNRNPGFIFEKVVDEMILVPIHQDLDPIDSIYSLNDKGLSKRTLDIISIKVKACG